MFAETRYRRSISPNDQQMPRCNFHAHKRTNMWIMLHLQYDNMRFSQPRESDDHGLEGIDRSWIVRRDQTVTANQSWSARCRVFALKEASDLAPAWTPFLHRGRTLPVMEQNGPRNFHRGE